METLRVKFYFDTNPDKGFIVYIQKKNGGVVTIDEIKEILAKYRKENKIHSVIGFLKRLVDCGFNVELIDYDELVRF